MSNNRETTAAITGILAILIIGSVLPHYFTKAHGQHAETTWARTYGGFLDDFAHSIQPTTDGGYVVVGQTKSFGAGLTDAWVMKLDSMGNSEWQKTYGGHNHDEAWSVDQTSDGGYIVAGVAQSFDIARTDAWLFKLDSAGQIVWEKVYGKKQGEQFYSVRQTSDGGYIAAGVTNSFGFESEFGISWNSWIVKTDPEGNIEWEKTYGEGSDDLWYENAHFNSGLDFAFSVYETTDEGFIVSGLTNSFRTGSNRDAWLFKLDSNGEIEWEKLYAQHAEYLASARPTADGGYIASSGSVIVKLDSDANLEWEKEIWAEHVAQTADGGYIAVGTTFPFEEAGDLDISLVKLDENGNVEWKKGYKGMLDQLFRNVEPTPDGGFIISTSQAEYAYSDPWILKVASDGEIADCKDDIVYYTNNTLSGQESAFQDTTAEVTNSSAVVIPSRATVKDIQFTIATQCGPDSDNIGEYYSLSLFEGGDNPSDGFIPLGEQVRAVAETNDPDVSEVRFRWIDPNDDVVRAFGIGSVDGPIASEQDFFTLEEQGMWVIEADFGNGQVVRRTLETTFFVLPESAVGTIGMLGASLGMLGIYVRFRMFRKRP